MKLKEIGRALKYPNYRLFFSGQIISLIGTWMQVIALSWLVYKMTSSPFFLGLVSFSSQIPVVLLSPFAGVISDRVNKHRIIIATQILSMVQALALSALVLTNSIQVWHIILLNIFIGVVNGFDIPNRQAFVVEMIENRDDLSNAIALNSSVFNGARLVGPSIAGILISIFGEGICFLINGLSYIAVIGALLAMKLEPFRKEINEKKVLDDLKEGFSYTFRSVPIRTILAMLALLSLVGMPYTVLMPVFAKHILGGDAQTLGFLLAAVGTGAFSGAFYLASRKSVLGLGKFIGRGLLIFGAGLIFFSFSRSLPLSLFFLLITGASMMTQMASSNTIIQTLADDEMRGRVMSFYTIAFMGFAPFGSLIAGSMAGSIGAPMTLASGGVLCIAGGVFFLSKLSSLREFIRPVYIKKGIIKEIPAAIDSASKTPYV